MISIGLLLCFATAYLGASQNAELFNNNVEVQPVEVPISRRAFNTLSSIDWQQFLKANLHPDLHPWQARAPLRAADILTQFDEYNKWWKSYSVLQLVLIYNNTIYWPSRPDGPKLTWPTTQWASPYKCAFHAALAPALASRRITLPNALFIYNTDDNIVRFGKRSRNLTAPSLSISRLSAGPALQPEGEDLDVLVPQMMYTLDLVTSYPWHLKKDIAFFRGKPHCTGRWSERYNYTDACSRAYIAWMSARDEAAGNATALDAAIYIPYKVRHPNGSIPENFTFPLKSMAPLRQHAKYKWLLNLEGMVAAFRLTQFMMLDSLILHQRTHYIEYFYRSLEPWKHYVPFWNATGPDGKLLGMDDVYGALDLVRRLDRDNPAAIQAIIANAQTFAIKFLHTPIRLHYYKAAIESYKALFPDMDNFLVSYVADLRAKGWSI